MGRNLWIKQLREEDGDLILEDNDPPTGLLSSSSAESQNKENVSPHEVKPEPRIINIGGKATTFMGKGDRLLIETPGGGAWGAPKNEGDGGGVGKSLFGAVKDTVKHSIEWSARGSLAERAAVQNGF